MNLTIYTTNNAKDIFWGIHRPEIPICEISMGPWIYELRSPGLEDKDAAHFEAGHEDLVVNVTCEYPVLFMFHPKTVVGSREGGIAALGKGEERTVYGQC